ncbi:hypothetical protein AB6A40_006207 [Gnathostoma spinigerum]|uniref:VWFA and cache domain-containing protein 1 n=1 Tax=Gnathostoma spinigerum TaxID=75299 RepID=A0ABD6ER60_9BILA
MPCPSQAFLDSTSEDISVMTLFIEKLVKLGSDSYSHARAIHSAYKLIAEEEMMSRNAEPSTKYHNIVHYISRGVMSELSEASSVLMVAAEIAVKSSIRVKINTLALTEGDKAPMMWSAEFLKNIASQNFSKYRQSFNEELQAALDRSRLRIPKGKMTVIHENENSVLTLSRMFELLSDESMMQEGDANGNVHWSYPFNEYQSVLMSMSTGIWSEHQLVGVVGFDVNLEVIADIIKYSDLVLMAPRDSHLRILICDLLGRVVMDSRLRGLSTWPLHIADVESWQAKDRWLSKHFASSDVNEGTFDLETIQDNLSVKLNYTWIRLENAPLVVVLVILASRSNIRVAMLEKNTRQHYSLDNLIYHRLDIQRDPSLPYCSHLGTVSSMNVGGVYLSSSCFTAAQKRTPSAQWIANYWVYLGDPFGLIRNTGIRPGVREHVGALSAIIPYWRERAAPRSHDYVIRRYIATSRGVMLTYPAVVVRDNYDPNVEAWYTRALKYPGRLVLTGPVLDSDLGQVFTLSTAIFEGQAGSMHNPKEDQIFAVIAMDLPAPFLAKIIRGTLPICKESRRCVLFDDLGYVLSRGMPFGFDNKSSPSFFSSRSQPLFADDTVERFHLNHLEPQLATRLLTNILFVEKRQCVQWATRSRERLFRFNVTFSDVITLYCDEGPLWNAAASKNLRAEVIAIPQSNVFLALINESCSPIHPIQAFCPCSVSDRRCLLCSRFDDAECECPCQCPIGSESTCVGNKAENSFERLVSIVGSSRNDLLSVSECTEGRRTYSFGSRSLQKVALPDCLNIKCERYATFDDCLGVIGCQWCSMDFDGQRLLENPYCSPIDQCFGGMKGQQIRGLSEFASQMTGQWSMATPVGPVAAGIMSVFLIMVIAVYCYRSQVNRLVETRSITDSYGAPLCGRLIEEEDFQFDHDGSGPPEEKVVNLIQLASFERISLPNQTTVRPQYRLSPRTESSDHGYSTMTDRNNGDESECATSSINTSRQTTRTLLPMREADDICVSHVTTEAVVHNIPASSFLST